MDTILAAQIIGAFFVITALAMLLRRKMMMDVYKDLFASRGMTFLLGVILLITGLLIVRLHNVWEGTVQTVVTVLGWLILIESIFYLFGSKKFLSKAVGVIKRKGFYFVMSLVYLILGGYLLYVTMF